VDYGTFGLWSGLMAGGKIVLPSGISGIDYLFGGDKFAPP
jgi:hypothetical protein